MGQQNHMSAIFQVMLLSLGNTGRNGRADMRVDDFILGC